MTISIRLGLASERRALEDLQRRASLNNDGDREFLLANPGLIELPPDMITAGQVFVALLDGRVAGFATVLPREGGDTELDGLFVEPNLWKAGVGRALVDHCAAFARRQGSASLYVTGNLHAAGFYAACGFENRGAQDEEVANPAETHFRPALLLRKKL